MVLEYKSEHRRDCGEMFFEVFSKPPFSYEWVELNGVLRYFEDLEKTPNFCGYILIEENAIKGACLGIISDYFKNKKYHISEIFIEKKAQGDGLGKAFMKEIEGKLAQKGIDIIELLTDDRIAAFEFYNKLGFVSSRHMKYMLKSIKKF